MDTTKMTTTTTNGTIEGPFAITEIHDGRLISDPSHIDAMMANELKRCPGQNEFKKKYMGTLYSTNQITTND